MSGAFPHLFALFSFLFLGLQWISLEARRPKAEERVGSKPPLSKPAVSEILDLMRVRREDMTISFFIFH